MPTVGNRPPAEAPVNRWVQLVAGVVCMVMIANLQYGWTYFVDPIDAKFHWGRTSIQVAFTIFVATETWLVPIEGWFVDRFGPRIVVMFGGIVVAGAWTLNSFASTLPMLYTAAAISGVGAGAVYGTCVGNALKWFADRRGLAAGLTAAGFGAGAAATVVPIISVIRNYGYDRAFLWFGLGQGLVILILSQILKAPRPGEAPKAARKLSQGTRDYQPMEMLRTPLFWILYVMFVLVAASGLVVTAQVAPIARDYKIAGLPVNFLFISSTVLVMAGIVDNILNGLGEADIRLGLGSHRAREYDGDRVHLRCRRLLGARNHRQHAVDVHRDGRHGLLHVGRDLQSVSRAVHGHLRIEVRGHQRRASLYGEGHSVIPGSGGELAPELDRQLARRVRRRGGREHRRRCHRAARHQADACRGAPPGSGQPVGRGRRQVGARGLGASCMKFAG